VLRVAVTFVFVLIAWVFFRAETFTLALSYLGSMFGLVDVPESSMLLSGMLYSPYYLTAMVIAAIVVWKMPQTWDYTKELSVGKVLIVLMVFIISIAVLSMQSYNPFIYFNF